MMHRVHHSFLTRCIDLRINNRTDDNPITKTESESIEAVMRRRRILFAGFVARKEDTRLPNCVVFGELVGGAICVGGQGK